MNHLETYAMAKPANVEATADLLHFATHGRSKQINYISTLGVFGEAPAGKTRVVSEESSIDLEQHPTSQGYAASKWVSEKMFMTAGERGIACNIFRLGLVWADSQHGRYDESQREYRLLKSCLLSGIGINNYSFEMAPLPVDYVARAIVALARQSPHGGRIYHLASAHQRTAGVFEQCNDIPGISVELMSHYEWVGGMKRLHSVGNSLPVVPLIEFAFPMTEAAFNDWQRRIESPATLIDCSQTQRCLERAGVVAPRWSVDLVRKCVASMLSRDLEVRRWAERRPRSASRRYG
jgi:myxalamid-type nonribosomal peptide synthetase MxaA